jgi:hypothetical protein
MPIPDFVNEREDFMHGHGQFRGFKQWFCTDCTALHTSISRPPKCCYCDHHSLRMVGPAGEVVAPMNVHHRDHLGYQDLG